MEGNFYSIYQSMSSLFACNSVSQKKNTILCIKRNLAKEKQRSGINKVWPKHKKQLTLQY